MSKESNEKQYTNSWFAERGGKTWDSVFKGLDIKQALEIGCYEGQASVYLLNKYPDMKLTVADIFDASVAEDWDGYSQIDSKQSTTYEDRFDNNVKEFGDRVKKHKGKSIYFLAKLLGNGSTKFDFIYIDGDHRKLPATQDMAMAIELLNPGGVMIIDDYKDIPWLFDAVNAFSNTLDSNVFSWSTTSDGAQYVIRRK